LFKVSHRLPEASISGRLLRLPLKLLPPSMGVPVLARLVQPGMRAFDRGANAGFYSLAFSHLVGEHGRGWALEPFAENVVNVRRHVRI